MPDNKNESLFKVNAEEVLSRGLQAMTQSCEALTKQNEILNKDIDNLKKKKLTCFSTESCLTQKKGSNARKR